MGASFFSPAKINLFLAITGRREDGFHDLVSVAAPLQFGDELVAEAVDRGVARGSPFSLECDVPAVPVDDSNLVLRAARLFAAETGWPGGVHFKLKKRIPMGAGLGGGSSNAVAALQALQVISSLELSPAKLTELAARLGSDCRLFLENSPVIMRGRGELVERLPEAAVARLRGRRLLVFKPSFGISTPWAYQRMIARGSDYLAEPLAVARLEKWMVGSAPAEDLLFNNMEPAAFEKYVALPVMLEKLQRNFGLGVRMSGSGSACFCLLADGVEVEPIVRQIRQDWGNNVFVEVTEPA